MDTTRMLGSGEAFEAEEPEHHGPNPLTTVHLLLQGRYWLAILLAIILAGVGAFVGYTQTKRTYMCMGSIHIRPVISKVLFNESGTMPMYDSFVGTQISMLKSQRCIDMAMASPQWLSEGKRSNSDAESESFKKRLEVARDGEIIRVMFTDADSATTRDAVAAMIAAYNQLVVELDPEQPQVQLAQLENLRTKYETQLRDMDKQVNDVAGDMTPEALRSNYTFKLNDASVFETQLHLASASLDNWKRTHPEPPDTSPPWERFTRSTWRWMAVNLKARITPDQPSTSTDPKTPEEIGRVDQEMHDLLQARANAALELEKISASVGPMNPERMKAERTVQILDQHIKDKAANFKMPPPGRVVSLGGVTMTDPSETSLQDLTNRELFAQRQFNEASKSATDLGIKVKTIRELESQKVQIQGWLDQTKEKLEALRVGNLSTGHIQVISSGDRPILKDRRIPYAAASSLGGIVAGFGLVILLGLVDRRLRTIDQAKNSLKQDMRVLGMLPSLPKNLEDPAAASFAALCVHHIRMLLQVMPRLDGHPAIAVTSPSAGDGKTSLTLSLALSYAASGKSTLLIDCDIVGAGLTRRVNAIIRRRVGQILIRENLITPAELREALSTAQKTKKKLGEVLVDEGYVDADQLGNALKMQGETSVGLLDVLRGEVLEECVADTGTPRLWILPVGSALAEHAASISPEGFRAVLDQARKRFDVILVDTGPIPGSIESSVAASQTDGVVLCVSRGEQGPLVKRAAEHLRDIGARALGVVFNRATPEDFSSSYGSMSSPSIPERTREKKEGVQAFGPMASAVVGQQRSLKE